MTLNFVFEISLPFNFVHKKLNDRTRESKEQYIELEMITDMWNTHV